MAGVLENIRKPRRQPIQSMAEIYPKVLELQAAVEILAEVFGVGVSEVDDMLKQRHEERPKASHRKRTQGEPLLKHGYNQAEEWPMEFCLIES